MYQLVDRDQDNISLRDVFQAPSSIIFKSSSLCYVQQAVSSQYFVSNEKL